MIWWHWLVIGLLLLIAEILSPGGFFLFFFGTAALVTGLLASASLAGPLWMQIFLFSVLSLLSVVLFRKALLNRFNSKSGAAQIVDSIVGEFAILTSDLPANGRGKAELRGTVWSVENAGAENLTNGSRCKVLAVQGLTLTVKGEKS